ncbi:hypothetical protein MOQ72_01490 [Saccharopolyspora sp. K220]|uniref:hypothetical protein n=1 Tax=Saccharopolyspora soli TaxID=2926618 RepID=UPI001F5930FB|nr:hypothetical protein [Saccharopolyspora soli]MCI2416084.1 hypothetical protein [Saccharopolyspora soli]
MTNSVRLLGSAAALVVGVLATSVLPQAVAMADTRTADTPGSTADEFQLPDYFGQVLTGCRPTSLTGQITVECSVAPNGESADGSEDGEVDF